MNLEHEYSPSRPVDAEPAIPPSPISFTSVSPASSNGYIESSVESLRTPTVSADKLHTLGVGPTILGFCLKVLSAITNSVDIGLDIYAAVAFMRKENTCKYVETSSSIPRIPSSNTTNEIDANSARDVMDIQLNYQTYGILTIVLLLLSSWIQSCWSYYMFWMEEKSNTCQCPGMAIC